MSDLLGRLFFAGFVRLHVLYHAVQEPICGVEIVAELGRHGYRLSPGTLYPVLHDLEEAGYLKGWAKVVAGKQRKYYEATADGRKALAAAREKLRELAVEVLEDAQPGRHRHHERHAETTLRVADLEMDLLHRRVTRGGLEISFTQREFELLHYLMQHKNTAVSREALWREVWKEPGHEMTNIIDVFISQLRKKLNRSGRSRLIYTIPKVGYSLREP